MNKDKLVITIERQYGSGGRVVGKLLSKELGIPYYDDEILSMTAERSAVGEQYFRLADERAGNNLLRRIVGAIHAGTAEDRRRRYIPVQSVQVPVGGHPGAGGAGVLHHHRPVRGLYPGCRRQGGSDQDLRVCGHGDLHPADHGSGRDHRHQGSAE